MPDNDFWIGREQIPVDLSLLLTYHNDEDYWYAPGEYALRVYTVDTLNTNFARPCFAFGERKFDPEMEDVSGAIENTLHELLDSGATPEDVYRIMGLVKESELSPETKEASRQLRFLKEEKNQWTFWCHRQSGYRISSPRPGDRTCHRRLEGGLRVHRP